MIRVVWQENKIVPRAEGLKKPSEGGVYGGGPACGPSSAPPLRASLVQPNQYLNPNARPHAQQQHNHLQPSNHQVRNHFHRSHDEGMNPDAPLIYHEAHSGDFNAFMLPIPHMQTLQVPQSSSHLRRPAYPPRAPGYLTPLQPTATQ